ncbi:MAG: hypothetical protein MJ078_02000 [Clostridia bacterium]|nr:hypothetical protein [Clostridia bacterium]
MLSRGMIEKRAKELGVAAFGIGTLDEFRDEIPGRDPKMILPAAKCILGFGFPVPKGLYAAMKNGGQRYTYTTLGVKYIDEEFFEIFLFRIGNMIEDAGFDACLQRCVPGLRIKGDKETNPEVMDTYELRFASPVAEGKPAPDVIIDFGKAAKACGIGMKGKDGRIINETYGPFMRYAFIITDAPLETNPPYGKNHCENCDACIKACPGHAVSEKGLNTWQCAVYYRGAHASNPFMTDDFLKENPERDAVLKGEKVFDAESAREIYPELDFLPRTQWGYAPCLCGKKCDLACYQHITGKDVG